VNKTTLDKFIVMAKYSAKIYLLIHGINMAIFKLKLLLNDK